MGVDLVSPLLLGFHHDWMKSLFTGIQAVLVLALVWLPVSAVAQFRDKRITFHDNKISMVLAGGWKEIKRPNTLMAYSSADDSSSIFFTIAQNQGASTMEEVMEGAIANFEVAFKVLKVGEYHRSMHK